ncbi:MAG: hypothetical protein INH41_01125 [Myxococcaceae bacterium]|jgi:hypothetical protein|nr:hypothetical protein [Myxococcaceae bacterium]MCA3010980.1 hypothetical protein [Myxococcaceae bacterium]
MSALALSLLLSAAPTEFDLGASLGASSFRLDPSSLQVGPRVAVGAQTTLGGVPLGARVSAQYDLVRFPVLEAKAQVFTWFRFGVLAPYAGAGLTAFAQSPVALHLHALLGLEARFGKVFGAFVELTPGALLDPDGAVFWAGGDIGVRFHFPVGQP